MITRGLFPLSLSEHVAYHGLALSNEAQKGMLTSRGLVRAYVRKLLDAYLTMGGFIASQRLMEPDALSVL